MPDLLLELFSEEIPARMQARAAEDLKKLVTDGLVEAGLTYESAGALVTPRRLTLTVENLLAASPKQREERKGPRADAPEKAIEGFLRSTGLSRDQLEVRADKKGDVLFAVVETKGRPAAEIIAEVVPNTIRNFPWPKSMRWGAGSLRWVRPMRSILCILTDEAGAETVPFDVDGIESGNTTEGHRFMAPKRFAVTSFDDYAAQLRRAHVILSPEERAEMIRTDMENQAFAQGLEIVEDKGLLAEVAGLVEWPVVLMGEIGADFLDLPPEVLQTSMKEHQKFFSVKNPKTGRIERYVTVANIEAADGGALILAGNSKVLSARLSDAKFFWENDLRVARAGMEPWLEALKSVTFHNKLGSVADRIERIAALASEIAPLVGADPEQAARAARLAKADLSSEMVYEFPELQGLMGRYYIEAAGEPADVAAVAQEHYSPLGPSDDVPTAPLSNAVALAEKLDVLTCFWAIDEKPTGSKDPFALRRAALGIIRIIIENSLRLRLFPIINGTIRSLKADFFPEREEQPNMKEFDDRVAVGSALQEFFSDRLMNHLRADGVNHDTLEACSALGGQDDLVLLVNRVKALQTFVETEDGRNLLAGYKRANNILTAEEKKDGVEYSLDPQPKLAEAGVEADLFSALDAAEAAIAPALEAEDFTAAMQAMATLRAPIDAFFDGVQVNADNEMVRRNRLCLLNRIRTIMNRVAIFSALEG
ncbi:glycine--tRNA ligase subunit beta [Algicella marina]|uniref:Glycine--tRNA ligase beta subunit n=1 Tax=Algicella marina TaxID=2683284 RepID=A0A6P1SZ43_9RHOB|nr:glycine--tRNA ligase subunit beta [Algicella marina]QHQ34289.1 glycine--tRNA ligase subunit beta [Algicella marina]